MISGLFSLGRVVQESILTREILLNPRDLTAWGGEGGWGASMGRGGGGGRERIVLWDLEDDDRVSWAQWYQKLATGNSNPRKVTEGSGYSQFPDPWRCIPNCL